MNWNGTWRGWRNPGSDNSGPRANAPQTFSDVGRWCPTWLVSSAERSRGPEAERAATVPRGAKAQVVAFVTRTVPTWAVGPAHCARSPTWDGARSGSRHPGGAHADRIESVRVDASSVRRATPYGVPRRGMAAVVSTPDPRRHRTSDASHAAHRPASRIDRGAPGSGLRAPPGDESHAPCRPTSWNGRGALGTSPRGHCPGDAIAARCTMSGSDRGKLVPGAQVHCHGGANHTGPTSENDRRALCSGPPCAALMTRATPRVVPHRGMIAAVMASGARGSAARVTRATPGTITRRGTAAVRSINSPRMQCHGGARDAAQYRVGERPYYLGHWFAGAPPVCRKPRHAPSRVYKRPRGSRSLARGGAARLTLATPRHRTSGNGRGALDPIQWGADRVTRSKPRAIRRRGNIAALVAGPAGMPPG